MTEHQRLREVSETEENKAAAVRIKVVKAENSEMTLTED